MAKAIAALRAMLKPMREMAVRRSAKRRPPGFRAAELASCSRRACQRRLGAHDAHHELDVHLLVGQRAAHARGHVRKTRQVDLFARQFDVQRLDQARQFRLARVRGTLRRRHWNHVETHGFGGSLYCFLYRSAGRTV
jgi:hypothetical protein